MLTNINRRKVIKLGPSIFIALIFISIKYVDVNVIGNGFEQTNKIQEKCSSSADFEKI